MHLGQGLDCGSCHVSAASSVKAEDNNLPPPEVCGQCHGGMTIKQPRATAVARFNHSKHVALRACTQCHHGIESSEATSKANFPSMAECISCHAEVDIPDSCYFCHAKTMKLTPGDHVTEFIDTHSRVKHTSDQKQACEACHGSSFRCAGCH